MDLRERPKMKHFNRIRIVNPLTGISNFFGGLQFLGGGFSNFSGGRLIFSFFFSSFFSIFFPKISSGMHPPETVNARACTHPTGMHSS